MGAALQRHEIVSKEALDNTRLAMTLMDVLALMRSNKSNFQNIAKSIEFDPSTANRLLRKVNSPYFQLDNPIRELPHAVSILGIRQIRELLLKATDTAFYHKFLKIESAMKELKKHSISTACYAEEYAKESRQYFTVEFYKAALLHDIGKFAMLVSLGADYLKVMREAERMNYSLHLHERDVLGYNHVEIGEEIAYAWEYDDPVRHVIKYHHEISDEKKEELPSRDLKMVEIISFANEMCKPHPKGAKSRGVFRPFGSDLSLPPGDLTVNQVNRISDQANSRYMEIIRSLGLMD